MVRVVPVSTFLIVTATSRRPAPVWSVTTPERLASVWARAKVKDNDSKKPTAAINTYVLRISTSKNHSFDTGVESVQDIRFYCLEVYGIVSFFASSGHGDSDNNLCENEERE